MSLYSRGIFGYAAPKSLISAPTIAESVVEYTTSFPSFSAALTTLASAARTARAKTASVRKKAAARTRRAIGPPSRERPARSLPETDAQHRDRPAVESFHREADGLFLRCDGEHVEERQEMIRRRHRERGCGAAVLVGGHRFEIARLDERADPALELDRPLVRILRVLAPGVGVEVVDHVARAEHQHLLVAQRSEPSRELEVLLRRQRLVDAELDDGDVGLRVEVHEERPRAVIEAPARVHLHRSRGEQVADA